MGFFILFTGEDVFQGLGSFQFFKCFHEISQGGFFSYNKGKRGTVKGEGTVSREEGELEKWCMKNKRGGCQIEKWPK